MAGVLWFGKLRGSRYRTVELLVTNSQNTGTEKHSVKLGHFLKLEVNKVGSELLEPVTAGCQTEQASSKWCLGNSQAIGL